MTKTRGKYKKNYIKEIRERQKISLDALARESNMTNQQVSNIELSKSRMSLDQLYKFADVLQVHPLDIIEGPAKHCTPRTDAQEKLLKGLQQSGLSEREQDLYVSAFLTGLRPRETETDDAPVDKQEKS